MFNVSNLSVKIQNLKHNTTILTCLVSKKASVTHQTIRTWQSDAIQAVLSPLKSSYHRSHVVWLGRWYRRNLQTIRLLLRKPSLLPFSGVDGAARNQENHDKFRGNAPKQFNKTDIAKTKTLWNKQLPLTHMLKIDNPPSNVLKYILADDSWFAVRPSGTEPKSNLHRYSWWNLKQIKK